MTSSQAPVLYFAWFSWESAWFRPNAATCTFDIEEAGRFNLEEISALKKQHAYGKDGSTVTSVAVSDIFNDDGTPRLNRAFEVRYDDYVLWGYGSRDDHLELNSREMLSPVMEKFAGGPDIAFQLPDPKGRRKPQEYGRTRTWAWRLFKDMNWQIADSVEAAEKAARDYAHRFMLSTRDCSMLLAMRHNRMVVNGIENPLL